MSQNHSGPKLPSSGFCFPKLAGAALHRSKKLRVEENCELAWSSLLPGAAHVCFLPGSLGLSLQTSSGRAHCRSGQCLCLLACLVPLGQDSLGLCCQPCVPGPSSHRARQLPPNPSPPWSLGPVSPLPQGPLSCVETMLTSV